MSRKEYNRSQSIIKASVILSILIFVSLFNAGCATIPNPETVIPYKEKAYTIATSGECKFPIIFAGDSVTIARTIDAIDFFAPTFGKDRPEVNPVIPLLRNGHSLQFSTPGEYYLRFNHKRWFLKVLVLSADEPISKAVLRIFDFCVANMVYCADDDNLWYQGRDGYILKWFASDEPAMLLCGPTMGFFHHLIEERLGLPFRKVTFPGAFYYAGNEKVILVTHNILEVYLPDIGKFVLFDINNSFVPRWLSAIELSKKLNEKLSDTIVSGEEWKTVNLDIYHNVESFMPIPQVSAWAGDFSPKMVSNNPVTVNWPSIFQGLSGGVAYWGEKIGYQKPTGTEFLPGDYLFASLQKNDILKDAAIKWMESFKLNVTVISPDRLELMLEEGHKNLIEAKPWLKKLPRQE